MISDAASDRRSRTGKTLAKVLKRGAVDTVWRGDDAPALFEIFVANQGVEGMLGGVIPDAGRLALEISLIAQIGLKLAGQVLGDRKLIFGPRLAEKEMVDSDEAGQLAH